MCGVGGDTDSRDRDAEFAQRDVIARDELHSVLKRTLADVDATLAQFDADRLLERRSIQGLDVSVLEAILHVVEHFSMHTGQILMMTKMLTNADLAFYDFDDSKAMPAWKTGTAQFQRDP